MNIWSKPIALDTRHTTVAWKHYVLQVRMLAPCSAAAAATQCPIPRCTPSLSPFLGLKLSANELLYWMCRQCQCQSQGGALLGAFFTHHSVCFAVSVNPSAIKMISEITRAVHWGPQEGSGGKAYNFTQQHVNCYSSAVWNSATIFLVKILATRTQWSPIGSSSDYDNLTGLTSYISELTRFCS